MIACIINILVLNIILILIVQYRTIKKILPFFPFNLLVIFSLTYLAGFVFRPLIIIFYNNCQFYDYWGFDQEEVKNLVMKALLIGFLGYLSFLFGYFWSMKNYKLMKINNNIFLELKKYSFVRYTKYIILFIILLCIISWFLYLKSIGLSSISDFNINSLIKFSSERFGGYYFQRTAELLYIFHIIFLLRLDKFTFSKILLNLLFFFGLIFILLSFYARQYVFQYIIGIILVLYRRKNIGIKMVIFIMLVLMIFLIVFQKGRAFLMENMSFSEILLSMQQLGYITFVRIFLIGSLFSYFDYFCLLIDYLNNIIRIPFYSIFYLCLSWIPRSFFSNKPVVLGRFLSQQIPVINPPCPAFSIFGEFLYNFGYIGIIIGCIIVGRIFRYIDFYLYSYDEKKLIYFIISILSFFMVVRSGFFSCLEIFLWRIAWVWFLYRFMVSKQCSRFNLIAKRNILRLKVLRY